jgi:hypothetical protein
MKYINDTFIEFNQHNENNIIITKVSNKEVFNINFLYLAKNILAFKYVIRDDFIYMLIILEKFSEVLFISFRVNDLIGLGGLNTTDYYKSEIGQIYQNYKDLIIKKVPTNQNLKIDSTDYIKITARGGFHYTMTVGLNTITNILIDLGKGLINLKTFKYNNHIYFNKILSINTLTDNNITGDDYSAIALLQYDKSNTVCIQRLLLTNLDSEIILTEELIYIASSQCQVKLNGDKIFVILDDALYIYNTTFNKLAELQLGNVDLRTLKVSNGVPYIGILVINTFKLYTVDDRYCLVTQCSFDVNTDSLLINNIKLLGTDHTFLECNTIIDKRYIFNLSKKLLTTPQFKINHFQRDTQNKQRGDHIHRVGKYLQSVNSKDEVNLTIYPVSDLLYSKYDNNYLILLIKNNEGNNRLRIYKTNDGYREVACLELNYIFSCMDISIRQGGKFILLFIFIKTEKDFLIINKIDKVLCQNNIQEIDKRLLICSIHLIPNTCKFILFSDYGVIRIYEHDSYCNTELLYEFTYSSHLCEVSTLRNSYDNIDDLIKLFEIDITKKVLDRYTFLACIEIDSRNESKYLVLVLNYGVVIFETLLDPFTGLKCFKYHQQIGFNENYKSVDLDGKGGELLIKTQNKQIMLKPDNQDKFVLIY